MTEQFFKAKKPLLLLVAVIALGVAGIFWLNRSEVPAPVTQAKYIEFIYELPGDTLALTHGFPGSLKRHPENITSLENSRLSNMIGLVARIRNRDGELVGLASELEIFPDDKGPRPGMTWDTHWTITTSEGSLLIFETETIPDEHITIFETVAVDISSGPHPSGRGIIVGGTGIYAGATGMFIERVELRGLTTEGKMTGSMFLQVYLDGPE